MAARCIGVRTSSPEAAGSGCALHLKSARTPSMRHSSNASSSNKINIPSALNIESIAAKTQNAHFKHLHFSVEFQNCFHKVHELEATFSEGDW